MKKIINHKGFTLVEVLFAVATGLIVMGAAYVAMISGQRSSVGIEQKVVAQQDVRASLELMSMEIGMASCNPNFVTGIWVNPAGCNAVSPNQIYRGIQVATPNAITVEMDITDPAGMQPEDGVVGAANEIISYVYDAANERITRETSCGGAQPFLGNVPGNPRSVRVINNTLNIPFLAYFDGLGNPIPAASLPVAIPNIRRVEITLAVETEDVDPATQQRKRIVYSNSVIPRNHAM